MIVAGPKTWQSYRRSHAPEIREQQKSDLREYSHGDARGAMAETGHRHSHEQGRDSETPEAAVSEVVEADVQGVR